MSEVAAMLRLSSRGARVLAAICVLADLVLAVANFDDVRAPAVSIIAWVLIAWASFAVTSPASEPMPVERTATIIAATSAATFLGDWNMPLERDTGYASWHFGAAVLVFIVLCVWGRVVAAWIGFGILVAITGLWTLTAGEGATYLLGLLPNQAGSLVVGTIFAIALRRQSARITELHAEHAALLAEESAAIAAADERERQSARLNQIARPALERIAATEAYTDAERERWLRLEATIRDGLRARTLDSTDLADAATRARERGVEVTLFDDSGGALESEADRAAVTDALIAELGRMRSGRLIGRVLPAGRGRLATILVDERGSSHRLDVGSRSDEPGKNE